MKAGEEGLSVKNGNYRLSYAIFTIHYDSFLKTSLTHRSCPRRHCFLSRSMQEATVRLQELMTKLNWAHWERQWAKQWQEEVPVVHHQVSALPEEPEDLLNPPQEGEGGGGAKVAAGGGGGAAAAAAAASPAGGGGGGGAATAAAAAAAAAVVAVPAKVATAGAEAHRVDKSTSPAAKVSPEADKLGGEEGEAAGKNKGCQCIIS